MNKYLLEALDAYPFDLAQAFEAMEYALSSDNQCPHTLCLYGRMYAEQLQDYPKAISYFEEALQSNLYAIQVYPYYINALLNYEEFEAAKKLIDFALDVKGADKGGLLLLKALYFEYKKEYNEALNTLKESESFSFNQDFKNSLKEAKNRIEEKKSPQKEVNKTKKKKVTKKKS